MASPLKRMKDEFGSKDKLVSAVVAAMKPFAGKDEALDEKLKKQSNLKLFKLLSAAKKASEMGGRDAVVEAVHKRWSRSKKGDSSLKESLSKRPISELLSYLE
jgi:hypothetical protein